MLSFVLVSSLGRMTGQQEGGREGGRGRKTAEFGEAKKKGTTVGNGSSFFSAPPSSSMKKSLGVSQSVREERSGFGPAFVLCMWGSGVGARPPAARRGQPTDRMRCWQDAHSSLCNFLHGGVESSKKRTRKYFFD